MTTQPREPLVIRSFFGWFFTFVGVVMGAAGIQNAISGGGDAFVILLSIATFMLVFGIRGLRISAKQREKKKTRARPWQREVDISQTVLRVARSHRGRVTPAEVAAEVKVSIDDARAELDRLVEQNYCQQIVGSTGLMVYFFPEFESASAKQDILEEMNILGDVDAVRGPGRREKNQLDEFDHLINQSDDDEEIILARGSAPMDSASQKRQR